MVGKHAPGTHPRTGAAAACGRCSTAALCGPRRTKQSSTAQSRGRPPRPTLRSGQAGGEERSQQDQARVWVAGKAKQSEAGRLKHATNWRSAQGRRPTWQHVSAVHRQVGPDLPAPQPERRKGQGAVECGWPSVDGRPGGWVRCCRLQRCCAAGREGRHSTPIALQQAACPRRPFSHLQDSSRTGLCRPLMR